MNVCHKRRRTLDLSAIALPWYALEIFLEEFEIIHSHSSRKVIYKMASSIRRRHMIINWVFPIKKNVFTKC